MTASNSTLRQRGPAVPKKAPSKSNLKAHAHGETQEVEGQLEALSSSPLGYKIALVLITLLAFATRFYSLGHPNQVVFDEVHFGKVCGHIFPSRAALSLSIELFR